MKVSQSGFRIQIDKPDGNYVSVILQQVLGNASLKIWVSRTDKQNIFTIEEVLNTLVPDWQGTDPSIDKERQDDNLPLADKPFSEWGKDEPNKPSEDGVCTACHGKGCFYCDARQLPTPEPAFMEKGTKGANKALGHMLDKLGLGEQH